MTTPTKVRFPFRYLNGETIVEIHVDGTKIRYGSGKPLFPESIDLKITNHCNLEKYCVWCHESSGLKGRHAELGYIESVLDGMPAGTEIAIGGGNPLDHPRLWDLLHRLNEFGMIVNMTINALHINPYWEKLEEIHQLVNAFGVTYHPGRRNQILSMREFSDHIVVHTVMGVHDIGRAISEHGKVLVLGFKQVGRGEVHFGQATQDHIDWNADQILRAIKSGSASIAFDNLALEQVRMKEHMDPEMWDRLYMGDDGTRSMFIDAVEEEWGLSSCHPRSYTGEFTAAEIFRTINP